MTVNIEPAAAAATASPVSGGGIVAETRRPRRLSPAELFGLRPLGPTLRQAWLVFRGDRHLPKSRFDLTSLGIATPRLSIATWLGRRAAGRRVPLLNLFNHTQSPPEEGWSVRVTRVSDFRGRALTYDSHNGTDFVVPPGTPILAAAPGRVVARRQEWNRGGVKLYVDHGGGLLTTYNHLGRTLVRPGDAVARGQPVALSAYSGADGLLMFPWVAPHLHFNVILAGALVDPFARPGEASLWREENAPRPWTGGAEPAPPEPTRLEPGRVADLLDAVRDPARRERLAAIDDPERRAFEVLIEATTYPTRFAVAEPGRRLFDDGAGERRPWLDLPFAAADFDGAAFCDDLGLRR
ncbi:MAG: M23 family metallopeptidase [Planctomycetes bacterium]|nr:M23 family metallopeptidase [Planctomycetota bacterium]